MRSAVDNLEMATFEKDADCRLLECAVDKRGHTRKQESVRSWGPSFCSPDLRLQRKVTAEGSLAPVPAELG